MLPALALLVATGVTDLALPRSFGSAPREQQRPRAAWSSSTKTWLVAWNEWSARGSILAARVDASGRVLDTPGHVLDAAVFKIEAAPRVASCGDAFAVVFAAHEGVPVVKGRRVGARTGRPVDAAPVTLSPAGTDARAPELACDETRGLAVVQWQVYGTGGVAARTWDIRSGELGPVATLEPGAHKKRHTTSSALFFDGSAFRSVWRTRTQPSYDSALHTARYRVPTDSEVQDLGAAQTGNFELHAAALGGGTWALVHRAIVVDPRRQAPQPTTRERWVVWRFASTGRSELALPAEDVAVHGVVGVRGGDLVIGTQRAIGELPGPQLLRVPADARFDGDVQAAPPLLALGALAQTEATRGCAICKAQWRLGATALASGDGALLLVWTDPVPVETSMSGPIPQQPIDVDVRAARVALDTLQPIDSTSEPLRVSTGEVLRRAPRAALHGTRGAVSFLEGEAKLLRVSLVDAGNKTAGPAIDVGALRRELHDIAPTRDGGLVVAYDVQQGTRLVRFDAKGRVVGQPVTRPLARHFALAFDGAGVWLAFTDEKTAVAQRLGDDLSPHGEPVRLRADLPVDRVAVACRAPGTCAVAFADGHSQIRLALVPPPASERPFSPLPVLARGGGPTLAWRDGAWVVGVVSERQSLFVRVDAEGRAKGEECASCGIPQGAMEGPSVPVLGKGGALLDVWRDGRRHVAGREGWFGVAEHGIGTSPSVAFSAGRALEVWQSGDSVRARLVD